MTQSTFIAQAIAVSYLTIGLGLMLNKDYYRRFFQDYYTETSAMLLSGFLGLMIGFILIALHNVWASNWTILITLIGWLSLIKGILIIIFPEKIKQLTKLIRNPENLSPLFFLLATIFGYFGLFGH